MLNMILPVLKNFREQIYQFFPSRRDATMEWLPLDTLNRALGNNVSICYGLFIRIQGGMIWKMIGFKSTTCCM